MSDDNARPQGMETQEDDAAQRGAPVEGAPSGPDMRLMMLVVVGMGVVLVIGFAFVLGVLIYRSSGDTQTAEHPKGWFGTHDVDVARGQKVRAMNMTEDRMAVLVGSDSAEEIIVMSTRTGEELGRFRLNPVSGFAAR